MDIIENIPPECPLKFEIHLLFYKFHILMIKSSDPDANLFLLIKTIV
jgi:hypothetical protein